MTALVGVEVVAGLVRAVDAGKEAAAGVLAGVRVVVGDAGVATGMLVCGSASVGAAWVGKPGICCSGSGA